MRPAGLTSFVLYFLKLGTIGFVAEIEALGLDLVESAARFRATFNTRDMKVYQVKLWRTANSAAWVRSCKPFFARIAEM